VAAAQVRNERVPGDKGACRGESLEPAHRP
jgi:hypothetical protein